MHNSKRLYINGLASCFGSHLLSDQLLYSLNSSLRDYRSNVSNRFSVLPESYLRVGANADFSAAPQYSTHSPSELAVLAVNKLLDQSGVRLEQIGLVLADTVTPRQTIPAEAQRICRLLGLKIACFDIMSGPLAFARFFSTLLSWKEERIPEYVLLISTNCITERIDFAKDRTALHFSDCSSAMLVSIKHPSSTQIVGVNFDYRFNAAANPFTVPIFAGLNCDLDQALPDLHVDLDTRFAPRASQVTYKDYGYSFGSTFGVALEKYLLEKSKPELVRIACGNACQSAIVELEVGVGR